jgi:phage terminase Nu1 subunit (DNA packaging protein)
MNAQQPSNLITTKEAAALTGRQVATIRSWVHREWLPVAGRGPRNAAWFDPLAVLNVERDCRARDMRGAP